MSSERSEPRPPPTPKDHPFNALVDRFPAENLTVLAHFYRGELSRSIAWRQKMDTTSHWAIITATALISVSFSTPASGHIPLIFASALIFLLLNIEGRRYRFFDVWRTRLRMLEVHFVVPAIAFEHRLPEGNWRETLSNDLFKPTFKISYWEAVGRRLQRNYIWLFFITFAAWCAKAYLDFRLRLTEVPEGKALPAVIHAFDVIGPDHERFVAWWVVLPIVLGFHIFIASLYIYSLTKREATGEIRRKDPSQKVWPM